MRILLITVITLYSFSSFAQDRFKSQLLDLTFIAPDGYLIKDIENHEDEDYNLAVLKEGFICLSRNHLGVMTSTIEPWNDTTKTFNIKEYTLDVSQRTIDVMKKRDYTISKEKDEGIVEVGGVKMYKYYCRLSSLNPNGIALQMEVYTYEQSAKIWSITLLYPNKFSRKPLYSAIVKTVKTLK